MSTSPPRRTSWNSAAVRSWPAGPPPPEARSSPPLCCRRSIPPPRPAPPPRPDGHGDWYTGGYGPLRPVAAANDPGVAYFALPAGFSYVVLGKTGTPMVSDPSLRNPAFHDGMAAFDGPGRLVRLTRNHEDRNAPGQGTVGGPARDEVRPAVRRRRQRPGLRPAQPHDRARLHRRQRHPHQLRRRHRVAPVRLAHLRGDDRRPGGRLRPQARLRLPGSDRRPARPSRPNR